MEIVGDSIWLREAEVRYLEGVYIADQNGIDEEGEPFGSDPLVSYLSRLALENMPGEGVDIAIAAQHDEDNMFTHSIRVPLTKKLADEISNRLKGFEIIDNEEETRRDNQAVADIVQKRTMDQRRRAEVKKIVRQKRKDSFRIVED